MGDKIACRIAEHRILADCLGALERIVVPSAVAVEALDRAVPCVFARVKHRILRLRAGAREEWPQFRREIREQVLPITHHCDTRWLVAICDAFAEHGDVAERGSATALSLLVAWEKLALTERLCTGTLDAVPAGPATDVSVAQPLWDGMTSSLDAPEMFGRLGAALAPTPVLHRILLALLARLRQSERSTVSRLSGRHARELWPAIDAALARSPERAVIEVGASAGSEAGDGRGVSSSEFQQVTLQALLDIARGVSALLEMQSGAANAAREVAVPLPAVRRDTAHVHLENICDRARLDIEKVKHYLVANGYELLDDRSAAEHVLLFGCAFNNHTEAESRRRLDEFRATLGPGQKLFVIEGLADTLGRELVRDGLVEEGHAIPTGRYDRLDAFFARKQRFADTPEANLIGWLGPATSCGGRLISLPRADQGGPVKFSVQVGHGCNDRCTFCGDKVVVKNLRSKPLEPILAEVRRGVALGYRYIELIGDDVGAWGLDLGSNLVELLGRVVAVEGDFSLNLQELNTKYLVRHVDELDPILASGRLRHLVVAFQSGNDRVLELMQRGYTRAGLLRVVERLRRHGIEKHGHAIVGFPTETVEEFEDTLAVIEAGGFETASFFVYQDRRTAPAHKLEPKVSVEEQQRRLELAERHFADRGYRLKRKADKLQIFREPSALRVPAREVARGASVVAG